MKVVMDFIADNCLWFIIGGVLLIMGVIGYIAEKTDFGKKTKILEIQRVVPETIEKAPEKVVTLEVKPEEPVVFNEPISIVEESTPNSLEINVDTKEEIEPIIEEPIEVAEEPILKLEPVKETINPVITEEKIIKPALPSIEELEQNADEDSEEDVWKF